MTLTEAMTIIERWKSDASPDNALLYKCVLDLLADVERDERLLREQNRVNERFLPRYTKMEKT